MLGVRLQEGEGVAGKRRRILSQGWRLWAARLAACAVLLQFLNFYAPPKVFRAGETILSLQGQADCLHHANGKLGDESAPNGCPVCSVVGCALPGAPAIALLPGASEILIGLISAQQPSAPPRKTPQRDSQPRGPPAFV